MILGNLARRHAMPDEHRLEPFDDGERNSHRRSDEIFFEMTLPPSSSSTTSVNVPPMSTPIR